jgi:hypothetical protein
VEDILYPIAQIVIKIYNGFDRHYGLHKLDHAEGEDLIVKWLMNPAVKNDHIIDTAAPVAKYMRITCEMSHGLRAFSLDYTTGQVWRAL